MPTLLQFGAGNIGRGFIAPTFAAAGWRIVFVEANPLLVGELNRRGRYVVTETGSTTPVRIEVGGVSAIDARDAAAVAEAVRDADLAATAVGLAVLPRLGAAIARGLAGRTRTLDILVCENGATAHDVLRQSVMAAGGSGFGAVRTSIGRMIPAPAPGADPLDITVEPYCTLPVDATGFTGPIPAVPHLVAHDDFALVLGQKLYLHNLTHACLAYAGHLRGCTTIPECMQHADLVAAVRAAGVEAARALAREHGAPGIADACLAILDDLLGRYRNLALADPVARVARDPWRKLAVDDRLVGAARLCLRHGIAPNAILDHILLACSYTPAADEPDAARFLALRTQGPAAVLAAATGLPATDPLMGALATAMRRRNAAISMRAAGLVLRDDEASTLEIADFGLDSYDRFGLAIHVYVNTARCCAKELVMLPGQCCPEHRHPGIAGEPGKEETFRVRQGEVFLYLPGPFDNASRAAALARLPEAKRGTVSVFRCVHLRPGEQCTLPPDTPHWFVAGPDGAVVSEFSTRSRDEADIFTDPAIRRVPA